jgi:hypothetical protein
LPGVELATFATSHNALGVSDRRGLVKALSKRAIDDCSWGCMVAAGPHVDAL